MYIFFNKANSYFTYRSFKSKIQNVEFQFGSIVTIHKMSCWCRSKAAMPGHAKDTLTRAYTHMHTHMRFGETPLPRPLCRAQHLELPVFRARRCWEHSTYMETTQTASHSLSAHGDTVMKYLPKLRRTNWKVTISNVTCTGALSTDLCPPWGLWGGPIKSTLL